MMSKHSGGSPEVKNSRRAVLLLTSLLLILSSYHLARDPKAQASLIHAPSYGLPQEQEAARDTPEVATLELQKPVERELSGGQRHGYQIELTRGQYVRVEIKQPSVAVMVALRQPDGKTISIFDIPQRKSEVAFERVAESSGVYRLDVYAGAKTPLGRYEIRVAELRPATEDETSLQQARTSLTEGRRLLRDGKREEARLLLTRALEIRERVLGPEHLEVAEALSSLALNYTNGDDYASAEPLRLRAFRIKEKAFGAEHPEVATELYRLGILYNGKGDEIKAEELFRKALSIFEETGRTESITGASALNDLGRIHQAWGDYAKAEGYYRRSLAIREKLLGADHFHLSALFASLGHVAYDAGDYAKAEAMFGRALALYERAFGSDDVRLTGSLNNLGMLYSTTGDYAKAEALYRRALSTHEQKTATVAPGVQTTLFGLARLYAARGLASEAVKFQAQAGETEERFIGMNLAVGSERQKLALLDELSLRSSRHISMHTDLMPDDPTARDLALTTALRRKGRAQDALSASLSALRLRSGATGQKLIDDLNGTTSELANLILSEPQETTSAAEHREQVTALQERREKLEAEISRLSAGFYGRAQPATLAAIRAAIPERAALVEFVVYRPFDPKAPDNRKAYGAPRYAVYVLRHRGEPLWKELGAAEEINAIADAFRRALRDPLRRDVREAARALDEKVMRSVRALAGDAGHLLVSPDGELNLIPFAALVDEREEYLIERYAITYLTSGRDLLRMGVARDGRGRATVIADPMFGDPVPEQTTRVGAARDLPPPAGRRRGVTRARHLSETYFAPLGGTAQEARAIKTFFPDAEIMTRAGATEAALKGVAVPRLLHVATHGFFLEDPAAPADSRIAARGLGANSQAAQGAAATGSVARVTTRPASTNAGIRNPLLRSGLALAGANRRLASVAGDDGILTALEASGLDLWGTRLVVLSACDTGVGEVRVGEGVYGLRRAFALAGAESLVMSLWSVSDYSTRKLMTEYYKNLKQGSGRGEALRRVQLDLLRRDPKLHPFYWANFIHSGEWADLEGER